jgi:anaphase-promoting complex subunit 1
MIVPQPFSCPNIYDWIQSSITSRQSNSFMTLASIAEARSTTQTQHMSQWRSFTPRTLLLKHFYASLQDNFTPAQFVEALASAGVDTSLLETLPEAVLTPLQEAILQCQAEPPSTWSKGLLAIIGREDVNFLLTPGQRPRHSQSTLLVCISPCQYFSQLTG